MSRWLPDWLPEIKTLPVNFDASPSDSYGFAPRYETIVTAAARAASLEAARKNLVGFSEQLEGYGMTPPLTPICVRIVQKCRTEGIAVAFVWLRESSAIEGWFPRFQQIGEEYAAELSCKLSVPIFRTCDRAEEDFIDGVHMLPDAAERYSLWFADRHLRPWLADIGVISP
jgi:hypothetical protein